MAEECTTIAAALYKNYLMAFKQHYKHSTRLLMARILITLLEQDIMLLRKFNDSRRMQTYL
jgi:hypothetical protein